MGFNSAFKGLIAVYLMKLTVKLFVSVFWYSVYLFDTTKLYRPSCFIFRYKMRLVTNLTVYRQGILVNKVVKPLAFTDWR